MKTETPGTIEDCLAIIEPILVCNVTSQILNKNIKEKVMDIAELLLLLSEQFEYDLDKPIHLICAKRHLMKSIYQN